MKHLLIDGKNAAYRSLFAARGSGVHPLAVFVRFISSWVERCAPEELHVFWEGPKEELWRKDLLTDYKEGPHREHGFDVEFEMNRLQKSAIRLLRHLASRQYHRRHMEADDLIYAFCRSQCREDVIIISSDGDFRQLLFVLPKIRLIDPNTMEEAVIDQDIDPVDVKCFMGDRSDGVPGYYGIGPKKAKKLALDMVAQHSLFKEKGRDIYLRNRKLVDLAACPAVPENILYVRRILVEEQPVLDHDQIKDTIRKCRVVGLSSELDMRLVPFQKMLRRKNTTTNQKG